MYNFDYHSPDTIEEALRIYEISEFPKYLAGGMTLIPAMKQKLSAPTDLISLEKINQLKEIEINNENFITIGSMCTHNQIARSSLLKNKIPGLSYLANNIADNAVRNKGTIGGSICNADPAADFPAAVLCLEGNIITNLRKIKANEFFIDMFETKLEKREIVKSIELPISKKSYYIKFASQASKYAIVGIFSCIKKNKFFISITGAANKAFILEELHNIPINELKNFNLENINFSKYSINSDINASSDYRKALIKAFIKKSFIKIIDNE